MKIINNYQELKKIRIKYKNKKIGLCHGAFDIFHIGHLNHIKEAKKNCDILIVSITSSKFISKSVNLNVIAQNRFPMHCMRLDDLLEFEILPRHDEIMARGLFVVGAKPIRHVPKTFPTNSQHPPNKHPKNLPQISPNPSPNPHKILPKPSQNLPKITLNVFLGQT